MSNNDMTFEKLVGLIDALIREEHDAIRDKSALGLLFYYCMGGGDEKRDLIERLTDIALSHLGYDLDHIRSNTKDYESLAKQYPEHFHWHNETGELLSGGLDDYHVLGLKLIISAFDPKSAVTQNIKHDIGLYKAMKDNRKENGNGLFSEIGCGKDYLKETRDLRT